MNPQANESSPSFSLPEVSPDKQPVTAAQEQQTAHKSEKQSAVALEQSVPAPAASAAPPAQTTSDTASQQAVPATGGSASNMPQIADDTDLIEKEWVDKAKEIVARTAHDPYLQNKEVTKMRADYLKKRYDKDVKLSD